MITMLVLLGLLLTPAVLLIVTLLRRGSRRTENVDGLLIEQQRRTQARSDRVSFNALAALNAPPTMTDQYRF